MSNVTALVSNSTAASTRAGPRSLNETLAEIKDELDSLSTENLINTAIGVTALILLFVIIYLLCAQKKRRQQNLPSTIVIQPNSEPTTTAESQRIHFDRTGDQNKKKVTKNASDSWGMPSKQMKVKVNVKADEDSSHADSSKKETKSDASATASSLSVKDSKDSKEKDKKDEKEKEPRLESLLNQPHAAHIPQQNVGHPDPAKMVEGVHMTKPAHEASHAEPSNLNHLLHPSPSHSHNQHVRFSKDQSTGSATTTFTLPNAASHSVHTATPPPAFNAATDGHGGGHDFVVGRSGLASPALRVSPSHSQNQPGRFSKDHSSGSATTSFTMPMAAERFSNTAIASRVGNGVADGHGGGHGFVAGRAGLATPRKIESLESMPAMQSTNNNDSGKAPVVMSPASGIPPRSQNQQQNYAPSPFYEGNSNSPFSHLNRNGDRNVLAMNQMNRAPSPSPSQTHHQLPKFSLASPTQHSASQQSHGSNPNQQSTRGSVRGAGVQQPILAQPTQPPAPHDQDRQPKNGSDSSSLPSSLFMYPGTSV